MFVANLLYTSSEVHSKLLQVLFKEAYFKISRGHFQGQEDQDGQPVEHVVDGGCGEGPLEVVPVANLAHRHKRVGHGGTDVGSHYHRDGLAVGFRVKVIPSI